MKKRILLLPFCVWSSLMTFSQETNVAFGKPVTVTSSAAAYPATNMVDGKISRTSKWEAANGRAPHIVEIDLKKYYNINRVIIHTGIRDEEKRAGEMTQAAGFWSAKNFKLQYWDDANWSDFPQSEVHENRLTAVPFSYNPAITTFKVRLVCDDGEPINIMEIEVMGTAAANMPAPPTIASSVETQQADNTPRSATVTVNKKQVGKTMKYVGYNQGYYLPGSNTSGWVEYSGVNGFRVWASLNAFVPESAVQVDKNLASVEEFDKRKAALRKAPEKNAYLNWQPLLPLYDKSDTSSTNAMVFNYALDELKRLGIDVILQISSTDFDSTWSNKWKQWQRYYALAYYAAKRGDVNMFALMNEPNHRNAGPMKLDQWVSAMQIVSDAVHCAVNDVNKAYGKKLVPKFVGPVTAGNNPEWWTAVAKNIRTDYHGNKLDKDLLQVFSTHSYNSPAVGYENRIENIQKIICEAHPAGDTLPIVYTEIGRWMNAYLIDKEETMDDPSLFTEWAGIYANNMKNGGHGMFAFKFANTASGPYPEGIKSGHHFVWHGQRIVEDAYKNLALNKPVRSYKNDRRAWLVVDGDKSDLSSFVTDTATIEKWVEIDLGSAQSIGSAILYTGDASGVYTSPTRIKNFKLQYYTANTWKDVPGTERKDNKYAQLFIPFKAPVTSNKIRFASHDAGALSIREIKLFAANDGPSSKPDFNISGIQRTGEVVRLFAKGFKNERPLYQTTATVEDNGFDHYTSYDAASGNYYMWLVQRGGFDYNLKLDLKSLNLPAGTTVTAETVNGNNYGEVSNLLALDAAKTVSFTLQPQSVVLLTIPSKPVVLKTINVAADATVSGSANAGKTDGSNKQLSVQLDASNATKNDVAYLRFVLPEKPSNSQRVLLKLNGATDKKEMPYRLHVYAVPDVDWKEQSLTWNSAPQLNKTEALMKGIGTKAFVAGELAFTTKNETHWLDVTDVVKRHAGQSISFVLVRETRQMGDDEDKGKKVFIQSKESGKGPQLMVWTPTN